MTSDCQVAQMIAAVGRIDCVVSYGARLEIQNPQLVHVFEGEQNQSHRGCISYPYPGAKSSAFVIPGHKHYSKSFAALSHTRSLTFLKRHMKAPIFDLEAIWEENTAFEFGNRSVENTMATMVQEPYVNHVPTVSCTIKKIVSVRVIYHVAR